MFLLRLTASTALATALALPAYADVTADDVWSNMQASYRALGGALSGTLTRTGETVTVADPQADFLLPMGSGSATAKMSGFAFVENGDGSVSMLYTDAISIDASATVNGETATFFARVAAPGMTAVATGDPGDVTYTSEMTGSDVSLGFTAPETPPGKIDVSVGGTQRTVKRITEGDLLTIETTTTVSAGASAAKVDMGNGSLSTSEGTSEGGTFTIRAALLPDGLDPLNIAAALQQGMALSFTAKSDGSRSTTTTTSNGQVLTRQESFNGPNDATFALDKDRFTMEGTGGASGGVVQMDTLGIPPLAFDLTSAAFSLAVPIAKSDTGQPATFSMALEGFRMGADVWAMFDPNKAIPRDPANIRVDVTLDMLNKADLLDFMALAALSDKGDLPVMFNNINISDLHLSGSGADVTGSGQFDLDYNDTVTYGGMPKPTGQGQLEAKGINALIDALIAAGVMTEDDAMGARFGMGMFADVIGDDHLRSTLDMGEDGSITVNGQRIK